MEARTSRPRALATVLAALAVAAALVVAPSRGQGPADAAAPTPAFTGSVHRVTSADLPSSWRAGCPVGPADLRLLRLLHHGFDGAVHQGELVVHADSAHRVLRVFHTLYRQGFPIERMQRVDAFGGSDDASMAANNTSAFNCRPVAGGTSWSEHAYGRAIDLNPVQNPYVSGSTVLPPAGRDYLDRRVVRPGMVLAGDATTRAFADQGWGWGGSWTRPVDYQHFFAGSDGRRPHPDPGTAPVGAVDGVWSDGNTVTVSGWALDRDHPWESIPVALYADGRGVGWYATEVHRADVNAAYGASGNHGFVLEALLPDGVRELSLYGIAVGPDAGANPLLGRVVHHVNPAHPPVGSIDSVSTVAERPGGERVRVRGWAVDRDDPAAAISVAVFVDGAGVAWFPTGVPRPDVNRVLGVTGDHGFDLELDLPDGRRRIDVVGIAVGADRGRNPILGTRVVDVGPRAPFGRVDSAVGAGGQVTLRGWALDPDTPADPVTLVVRRDGAVVAEVVTSQPRPDVNRAHGTTGDHGFEARFPAPVGPSGLTVHARDTAGRLADVLVDSRTVSVAPLGPLGSVDAVTAVPGGLEVRGWALDRDTPAADVPVAVYLDGVGVAWFPTGIPRPDVNAAFGTAGDHGFAVRLDAAAGRRTVTVYAIGAHGTALAGSGTVTVP
ncbi:M15 family metallopeptidase [Thalassiella azotivora]